MAIQIIKDLVSKSKYGIKCPYPMDAEYITYHNTANDADADNEIGYMISNDYEISYHFAVDSIKVVQGIPTNRNAWHCGDGGKGTGNRKSIGVEVCHSESGGELYDKAEALANKFIAQLLHERGWGVDRVKPHHYWSGKNCPHRILDDGRWDDVLAEIQNELDKLQGKKPTKPISKPKPKPAARPSNMSVVDYMNSRGMNSSFSSREKLAKKFGIKGYKGSAKQNLDLLRKLREDVKKPSSKPSPAKSKGDMKTNSIVEYLQSIGVSSSFSNREKLSKKHGIRNYEGTASQNLELLDKLRRGKPVSKPATKPKPKQDKISGIPVIGHIQIVNVLNAAYICDRPSSSNSKNLATAKKGSKWPIAGSVPGWYEVIYKGRRAYVNAKYGKRV